jgi:chromosome segregation ATPase
MQSKNYYIDPVTKTKIPDPPKDLPEDHWARRELMYWETAFDRLRVEYADAMRAVDAWKTGHDSVLAAIHEWEQRYTTLSEQLHQARVWEEEHKKVVTQLENWVRMYSELKLERDQAFDWEAEHKKVVAQLEDWVRMYSELKLERDQIESFSHSKDGQLRELSDLVRLWQSEHAKVVKSIETHAGWVDELRADRDRFVALDAEKKAAIDHLTKEIVDARATQEIWKAEHGKVVRQVEEWVRRFEQLRVDHARVVQWDREKAEAIARLTGDIESLNGTIRTWQGEHRKVEAQVKYWVQGFESLQKERDAYARWDADKKAKISELEVEVERLLRNPIHYAARSLRRLFSSSE